MPRKIRVLVGKPGLDGHDRGAKVVAAALRDAGMEVIYTGLHQTSEQVVEAALQEDVDVVALSILSGAHMTLFPEVIELMRQRGIGDRLLTGGGIIPPEDMETLASRGVGRLFGPGSSTQDIVEYIRDWFAEQHGADALTPLPPAREIVPVITPAQGAPARGAGAASVNTAGAPARPRRRSAEPKRSGKSASARRGSAGKGAAKRAAPKRSAGKRVVAASRASRRVARSSGSARRTGGAKRSSRGAGSAVRRGSARRSSRSVRASRTR